MAQIGTLANFTFSGLTGDIISISMDTYAREPVQTSHLGTTTAHTFIPTTLYDPGTVELEFLPTVGGDFETAAVAAAGTLTVVWADSAHAGVTVDASVAASAFVTNVSWNVPLEELVTVTVSFKLTGAITYTAGS